MNARLLDADWRSACGELPCGERPLWLDDDDEDTALDAPALPDGSGLCARGVGVRAGSSTLLQGVDLQLAPGEVGAILGPNGAGKSTLLSVLAGLRAPDSGQVHLNGLSVNPLQVHALARHRAVLPQETAVAFDFRVQEVVELGRYPHQRQPSKDEAAIVRAAMQATGVAAMAGRSLASLSGGERARVQLARVMAQIWEPGADGATPRSSETIAKESETARRDFHRAAQGGDRAAPARPRGGRGAALQAFFVANAGRALLPGNETSGAISPQLRDEET